MAALVAPVTINTGDMRVTLNPKGSWGDNPTFYALQVEEQLQEVAARARTILEATNGEQYTKNDQERLTTVPRGSTEEQKKLWEFLTEQLGTAQASQLWTPMLAMFKGAWDGGWSAFFSEEEAQREDEWHPITANNPYDHTKES